MSSLFQRRAIVTSLPLYHSGHLLKKRIAEKGFKGYYAELRGATIFLYHNQLQDTYTEKLDLEDLKSIKLDVPYQKTMPVTFTLRMKGDEVKLKMENPDSGEEWRCYILTVTKKEIPSKIHLLPGQVLKLQEALTQERRRTQPLPCPPLPPRPSPLPSASISPLSRKPTDWSESPNDVPACFFRVTRQEAEEMLEANPEHGGLIIRPSSVANSYALSLRLPTPSGHVMKNYRVSATKSGFVIELNTAVTVSSLHEVVKYFQEKTEYRLHPYSPPEAYDTWIDLPTAPRNTSTTSGQPGPVQRAEVAPMLPPNAKDLWPPEALGGGYVYPDSHGTVDLKPKETSAHMERDGVLKLWREEEGIYENKEP